MNRTPLKIISLSGTPTDIAFQLGQKRKSIIQKRVDYWNHHTSDELFKGRRSELKALEKGFLDYARKDGAPYLEEIRAMAEGAHIPFADLFRLNLTELRAFTEKCTTLILPIQTPQGKKIMIAHNEDWSPDRNDVFILKATLPDVSYVIVAYDGYLPGLSSGFNSHGFIHAINYVPTFDLRVGIPRIFMTRHLVTAPSFESCLKWFSRSHRAFGQSIHMAQGDRYLGVELTATSMSLRRPPLPTSHSNHTLSMRFKKHVVPPSPSSHYRLEVSRRLLKKHGKKNLTPAEARALAGKVLSDRSAFPYALWREADNPEDTSATLVMALLRTDRQEMEAFRQRPSDGKSISISL